LVNFLLIKKADIKKAIYSQIKHVRHVRHKNNWKGEFTCLVYVTVFTRDTQGYYARTVHVLPSSYDKARKSHVNDFIRTRSGGTIG